MSRNFELLAKGAAEASLARSTHTPTARVGPARAYSEVIRRLFHAPSAVAIVDSRSRKPGTGVCETIGIELAARGKRVVVVPILKMLRMDLPATPVEGYLTPGGTENVWLWLPGREPNGSHPAAMAPDPIESLWRPLLPQGNWLTALRCSFDSVLLDCPPIHTAPGVPAIAALADSTVLVVEAGRRSKQRIQRDQQEFESGGAKLVGCILVRRS
jgi:polysaccharide biosynthesis transport protein